MSESNLPPGPTDPDAMLPQTTGPAEAPAGAPSDPAAKGPGAGPPGAVRKRRRLRWVLGSIGALLVLLLLLLVLAPTLLSMGWARSIVIGQVNKHLNGRVEVADYSLSWTGGIKASGVKLYDAENKLVADIGSFSTQLSLLKAMRGNYDLGETVLSHAGFTVKQYADGSTNLGQLVKQPAGPANPNPPAAPSPPANPGPSPTPAAPSPPANPGPSPTPAAPGPSRPLPPVRAHLVLEACHGTFEKVPATGGPSHVVIFRDIEGDVKVPDINSPIENNLKVVASVDNGPDGAITADGVVAVVRNNLLDTATGSVKESVVLSSLDLGAAAAFLPPSVRTLTGVASGNVSVDLNGGKAGTIGASLDVQKPTIALASFNGGGAVPLDHFNLTLPPTSIDMSPGPERRADWRLRVGDGRAQQIAVVAEKDGVKLLNLTIAADVTPGEVLELAANRRPGGAGRIEAIAHADVGRIARLVPRAMHLRDDVEVTSGQFQYTLTATFAPDSWALSQSADLSDVKGRNTAEKRDVALRPLHLSFDGTSFGGGWQVPDLRRLALALGYGDAVKGDFRGETLTTVNGTLHARLQDLLADVEQFQDLGGKKASGDVTLTARAEGDLANVNAAGSTTAHLQLAVRDLDTHGFVGSSPGAAFAQSLITLDLGARVDRGPDGAVSGMKDVKVLSQAGDPSRPTWLLDVEAAEVAVDTTTAVDPRTGEAKAVKVARVPNFVVRKLDVPDLRLAQEQFGAMMPALKGVRIDRGSLSMAGSSGAYDGTRQALAFQVSVRPEGLTVSRLPEPAAPAPAPLAVASLAGAAPPATGPASPGQLVEIVSNYSLPMLVAGRYAPEQGVPTLTLSALSIKDNKQWLGVDKAGDNIQISLPPKGPPQVQGELKLTTLNLAAWSGVARRLAGGAEDPDAVKLTSGTAEGSIKFAPGKSGPGSMDLEARLDASQLTATGGQGQGVQNEWVRLVLRAGTEAGFGRVKVSQLDATGTVFTARVPVAEVWLRTGDGKDVPVLQKLRQLTASFEVPDAGKAQALYDGLFPAKPPDGKAKPAAPAPLASAKGRPGAPAPAPSTPAAPAKLTAGRLVVNLDVHNDGGQLVLKPDVKGTGLALASGSVRYTLGDVAVAGKVLLIAAADAGTPGPDGAPRTAMKQIRQLLVPEFVATGAGSSVYLAGQPIVINDPAWVGAAFDSARASTSQPATDPGIPAGKSPGVEAAVVATGDLASVTNLLDVLGGRAPAPSYQGAYNFQQKISLVGGSLKLSGQGTIQNFAALDADHRTPTFTEKTVRVDNAVSLAGAPGGPGPGGQDVLKIDKLSLTMESSKAGSISLTGTIRDLSGERQLENVVADVTYDWAQLWPILHPMLMPRADPSAPKGTPPPVDKLKDLKIAGTGTQRFTVSGKYPARLGDDPAPLPFNRAVASLSARGAVGVTLLNVQGIDIRDLTVRVDMKDGVLALSNPPRSPTTQPGDPPRATCNNGFVNLSNEQGGLAFDLTAEHPRLSAPAGLIPLEHVTLNPILADFLGDMVNNPLLVDPKQATGVLDLTLAGMTRMPVDGLASQNVPANDGRCELDISLKGIQLGNKLLYQVAQASGDTGWLGELAGDVNRYHVSFHNGTMSQDFNMTLARRKLPLRMTGDVRLADQRMMPVTVNFPAEFFSKAARVDLARLKPEGFSLPLTGTLRQPQFDFASALKMNVGDLIKDNLLDHVPGLNKPRDDKGDKGDKGAKPKNDPLGTIGDLIGGARGGGDKPPATAPSGGRKR